MVAAFFGRAHETFARIPAKATASSGGACELGKREPGPATKFLSSGDPLIHRAVIKLSRRHAFRKRS
jgi:hypothetical protein